MRHEGSMKLDSWGVGGWSIEGSNVICASQSASRQLTKSGEGERKKSYFSRAF